MALAVAALAGCGAPPGLGEPTSVPTHTAAPTPSGPSTAPATPPTTAPSLGTVTPTPDAGLVATACRNGPTGQRVLQLLRGRAGVLPANVRVQVRTGPLCAADWQFTVLTVTGHEELQVVTRGRARFPGAGHRRHGRLHHRGTRHQPGRDSRPRLRRRPGQRTGCVG